MSNLEVNTASSPDRGKFKPSLVEDVPAISVDPTGTFPGGSSFNPKTTPATGTLSAGSQITLQSSVTNLDASVYTYQTVNGNLQSISAFGSKPPYKAPMSSQSAATYTLSSAATGLAITISLSSSPPTTTDPKNGTINVGGTTGGDGTGTH
jgi:hypothetical protein